MSPNNPLIINQVARIKLLFLLGYGLIAANNVFAQNSQIQKGIVIKAVSDVRIGDVAILNKRTLSSTRSNLYGNYSIGAKSGETLQFKSKHYQTLELVLTLSVLCWVIRSIAIIFYDYSASLNFLPTT